MRTFVDGSGDQWSIRVTAGAMARIRDQVGVDFLELTKEEKDRKSDEDLLIKLVSDPLFAADVLAAVCMPQILERGLTSEAFLDRLGGEALASAVEQLAMEVVDFFLQVAPEVGAALRFGLETYNKFKARLRRRVSRRIEKLSSDEVAETAEKRAADTLEREATKLEARLAGTLSTSSPAASESTGKTGHSAS